MRVTVACSLGHLVHPSLCVVKQAQAKVKHWPAFLTWREQTISVFKD